MSKACYHTPPPRWYPRHFGPFSMRLTEGRVHGASHAYLSMSRSKGRAGQLPATMHKPTLFTQMIKSLKKIYRICNMLKKHRPTFRRFMGPKTRMMLFRCRQWWCWNNTVGDIPGTWWFGLLEAIRFIFLAKLAWSTHSETSYQILSDTFWSQSLQTKFLTCFFEAYTCFGTLKSCKLRSQQKLRHDNQVGRNPFFNVIHMEKVSVPLPLVYIIIFICSWNGNPCLVANPHVS